MQLRSFILGSSWVDKPERCRLAVTRGLELESGDLRDRLAVLGLPGLVKLGNKLLEEGASEAVLEVTL